MVTRTNVANFWGAVITSNLDVDTLEFTILDGQEIGAPNVSFRAKIYDGTNQELVLVTSVMGSNLTVTRGLEGTTPYVFGVGSKIECVLTAGQIDEIRTEFDEVGDSLDEVKDALFYLGASGVNGVIQDQTFSFLKVTETSPVTFKVNVSSGYGYVNNLLYVQSTDVELDIQNSSDYDGVGTGGTPTISHRIDLVVLMPDRTLKLVEGAENFPPVAPSKPANSVKLAEIYLRPSMTTIQNTDDTVNGYITEGREFI